MRGRKEGKSRKDQLRGDTRGEVRDVRGKRGREREKKTRRGREGKGEKKEE